MKRGQGTGIGRKTLYHAILAFPLPCHGWHPKPPLIADEQLDWRKSFFRRFTARIANTRQYNNRWNPKDHIGFVFGEMRKRYRQLYISKGY